MNFTHLAYRRSSSVAVITLDRPEARNAYSDEMIEGLCGAFDLAEADDEVHAVVLTGTPPAFSAGGDLKAMRERSGMFAGGAAELRERYMGGIHRIPRRIAACRKVIVAAINGAAIGAGLDLACMCDLRVLARGAKLGSTFVKVGLVPGDGGAYFLTRAVGFSRALEMILTGRLIDDAEALRIGLVHYVVDPEEVVARALELAQELAALPPAALRLAKQTVYASADAGLEQALELAASHQGLAQSMSDHEEAVASILDKRPPRFTGR